MPGVNAEMRTALKFIAKQRTKPLCESILLLQVLPFLNIRYGDSYYQAGSCAASEFCSSAQHICATKAGYDQLLELIKSVSVVVSVEVVESADAAQLLAALRYIYRPHCLTALSFGRWC